MANVGRTCQWPLTKVTDNQNTKHRQNKSSLADGAKRDKEDASETVTVMFGRIG